MSHLFKQVIDQATTTSAFGETVSVDVSPVFQLDGIYGVSDETAFQINTGGDGSASTTADGLMEAASGSNPGAFGLLRSNRSVRYRPGQGSMARFTAMWPDGGLAGYQQVAGFINQSDVLGIGFNVDSQFGIIRRYNSKAEIYEIAVDTVVSGADESVTITLNDAVFNITLTAKTTTAEQAAELASATTYTQWIVTQTDNVVTFLYNGPPGNLTGAFSVVNNDGTPTFAATDTTRIEGAAPTDSWVYQSSFNLDTLDGNGPSGMTIDTTKLNVFQIDFRWLGAGRLRFAVEDPNGLMIPFHEIHYSNLNIVPSLSNPSMRIGYAAVNAAPGLGTGTPCRVQGASMMGAIQGQIIRNNFPDASYADISPSPSLAANIEHHVLTLNNRRIFGSGSSVQLNQREILVEELSATLNVTSGQNAIQVLLYLNSTIWDQVDDIPFVYTKISDTAKQSISTGERKPNTGKLISVFTASSGDAFNVDLTRLRLILAPNDYISVFARSTNSAINRAIVGITYTVE